jgi:hypothetical protein
LDRRLGGPQSRSGYNGEGDFFFQRFISEYCSVSFLELSIKGGKYFENVINYQFIFSRKTGFHGVKPLCYCGYILSRGKCG